MKIVCIADTHNQLSKVDVPDGDVLIIAGDVTGRGTVYETFLFHMDVLKLPHEYKILVAGNHDWFFTERDNPYWLDIQKQLIYIEDSGCTIDGIKFWGSPWQPEFCNWAFNLPRGEALKAKWDLIPEDTDVLITHGPPFGILDKTNREENVGCEELRKRVDAISPKFHVFGHVHNAYGTLGVGKTVFINASICTESYEPINLPIVFEV